MKAAQQRAKLPRSAIAGPYGHPFHATLVPVPIGAFAGVLVLDVLSRTAERDGAGYARASTVLLGVGLAGALLAAVFGFLDYGRLARRTKVHRVATTHLTLNLLVVAALGVSFVARLGSADPEVPAGLVALTAVALAVLAVSGWLGGHLAYRYGVRVADEVTQAEGYREVGGLLPDYRKPATNVPVDKAPRR